MSRKVFVGNLNYETTASALENLFSEVGSVRDVFLPNDRATGRPRGFAFVEFASEDEAAEAISRFDGRELDGRPLRINAADDRPRRAPRSPMPPPGNSFGGFGASERPRKEKGSRRRIRSRKRSL